MSNQGREYLIIPQIVIEAIEKQLQCREHGRKNMYEKDEQKHSLHIKLKNETYERISPYAAGMGLTVAGFVLDAAMERLRGLEAIDRINREELAKTKISELEKGLAQA